MSKEVYQQYIKYKRKYLNLSNNMYHELARVDKNKKYDKYDEHNSSFLMRLDNMKSLNEFDFLDDEDCDPYFLKEKSMKKGKKSYLYLTKGGQGAIYFLFIVDDFDKIYQMAMKYVDIQSFLMKDSNLFRPKFKKWRELFVLKKCTKYVKNRITQNLPIMYGNKMCKDKNRDTLLIYSELADGNLLQWLDSEHSVIEWKSLLFQIWHALDILQTKLQLVHNDMRLPNILFFRNDGKSVRYIIDNEKYYLENLGYVFIIWDYGSCETLMFPGKDEANIRNKLESNKDLHFLHDMYNRIRVFAIMNRYKINEMEKEIIKTKNGSSYIEREKAYNKKRFDESRFKEKYKISMAYYITENNLFDKMYQDRIDNSMEGYSKVMLPPKEVDDLLLELSNNYNYDYKDALSREGPKDRIIPNPKKLIKKFMSEFTVAKDFDHSFYS
jgi:hypothetical protein